MSIIDDINSEINNMTFTNKIIVGIFRNNSKKHILNKIKKKYGTIMYDKYKNLIEVLIDITIEENISITEMKRDMDVLFGKCSHKPVRRNSWVE